MLPIHALFEEHSSCPGLFLVLECIFSCFQHVSPVPVLWFWQRPTRSASIIAGWLIHFAYRTVRIRKHRVSLFAIRRPVKLELIASDRSPLRFPIVNQMLTADLTGAWTRASRITRRNFRFMSTRPIPSERSKLDITSVPLICQKNPLRLGSRTLSSRTSCRSKAHGPTKIP